jgi:hypothetical protein
MPATAQPVMPPPPPATVTVGPMVSQGGPVMNRWGWGHRVNGRRWGGVQAPGGWVAYRRPTAGFILPGYWLQPSYHIANYRSYGLPRPAKGYGWSRYYDDAVLTDEYGKVYDSRINYDWERYGGYDDTPPARADDRRDGSGRTVAGAVIGGVTGGLLGSAIAGPGNRTGGAIIGAGVGAIAGAAVGSATAPDSRRRDDGYDDAPGYRDDGYDDWRRDERNERERKIDKEELKQQRKLDKLARKAGYPNYAAYLRARNQRAMASAPQPAQPHWAMRGGPENGHGARRDGAAHVETYTTPGHVAGGYYFPGTTVTTVTLDPSVTTSSTTETYYTTVAKPARPRTKIVKRRATRATCRC